MFFWLVLFNRKPTGEFIPSKNHFDIAHNAVHNHCGLPSGIAVVPREIDDSSYPIFFRGVMEGAPGKTRCMGDVKIENTRNKSKRIILRKNKFNVISYRDDQMVMLNVQA